MNPSSACPSPPHSNDDHLASGKLLSLAPLACYLTINGPAFTPVCTPSIVPLASLNAPDKPVPANQITSPAADRI